MPRLTISRTASGGSATTTPSVAGRRHQTQGGQQQAERLGDDLDAQHEFALYPVEEKLARDVAGVETNRLATILLANDVAKVVGAREGDQPGRDLEVLVGIHEVNTGVNVGVITAENFAGREDAPTADNPGGAARIERDIAGAGSIVAVMIPCPGAAPATV